MRATTKLILVAGLLTIAGTGLYPEWEFPVQVPSMARVSVPLGRAWLFDPPAKPTVTEVFGGANPYLRFAPGREDGWQSRLLAESPYAPIVSATRLAIGWTVIAALFLAAAMLVELSPSIRARQVTAGHQAAYTERAAAP